MAQDKNKGVWGAVLDQDTRFLEWSPGLERLLGYPAEQLTRLTLVDATHASSTSHLLSRLQPQPGGPAEEGCDLELLSLRGDGLTLWTRWKLAPLSGGRWLATVGDVSNERQHRLQDEASRQRHLALLKSASDYVSFSLDVEGRISSWNRRAARLFGISELQAVGARDELLWSPEDAQEGLPEAERERAAQAGVAESRRWHARPDGSRVFLSGVLRALREPTSGELLGFIKVVRDDSARKRDEEELQAARQRSDTALYAAEVGTYWWHVGSPRIHGDRNFLRLLSLPQNTGGVSVQEVAACVDPAQLNELRAEFHSALRQGREFEFQFRAGERWLQARGRTEPGDVSAVAGVVLDISDRKKAEASAQASELQFRAMFEHAPVGIVITEPDGRFQDVNAAYCAITGYSREELLDENFPFVELTHVDDRAESDALREALLDRRLPAFFCEKRYRRRNGELIWVRVSCSLRRESGGVSRGLIGLVENIDARKRAEAELRSHVAERELLLTSERVARAQAEQASRMKDEFLATVSHELRTPLTTILGWATILKQTGDRAEVRAEGLDVIHRNARAQGRLIDDVLDIARITAGTLRLGSRPVLLSDVLSGAVSLVTDAARSRSLSLVLEPVPAASLWGDRDRLQQVFWNLLSNAVKFSEPGGAIRVSTRSDGPDVVVAVADTGKGMEADFLASAFEQFRQADARSTRRHGGLGLGLALVRQIVELHGGQVEARSPGLGQGSTFVVRLPHLRSEHPPLLEGGGRPLEGRRLLLLADQAEGQRPLKPSLEAEGAEVIVVGSVADALGVLLADPEVDAAVGSLDLAEEDGCSLASRWRQCEQQNPSRKVGARLPLLALTTVTEEQQQRDRARQAGFDAVLARRAGTEALTHLLSCLLSAAPRPAREGSDGKRQDAAAQERTARHAQP